MAFSLSNNVITQTGTDTDLSGLSAIAGVQTITPLGGGGGVIYILNTQTLVLRITGTVSVNVDNEQILFEGDQPNDVVSFEVTNTGSLILSGGGAYAKPFITSNDAADPKHFRRKIALSGSVTGTCFSAHLQKTVEIDGNVNVSNFILRGSFAGLSPQNLSLVSGASLVTDNLIISRFDLTGQVELIDAKQVTHEDLTLLGRFMPLDQVNEIANYRNTTTNVVNTMGFGSKVRLVNSAGALSYISKNAFGADGSGLFEHVKRISNFRVLDQSGAGVEGAAVFIRDADNGLRKNYTFDDLAPNLRVYTQTQNVLALTDSTGQAGSIDYLYAVDVANEKNGSDRSRDIRTENSEPQFRIQAVSYATLYGEISVPIEGDSGSLALRTLPDLNVTLSEAGAGALTTIVTADELYDAAKYWKTRGIESNLEYPSIDIQPITGAGALLDLGTQTLVMQPSGPVFNGASGTITVNATTIAAGVKFDTIRATEVVGDLDGVNVQGSWRTQLPVALTGRNITKLIVDGGIGDISLTNCVIGEIENQSGNDVSLFLTGTATPTLTETNGGLNIATSITIADLDGDAIKIVVIDTDTKEVIKPFTTDRQPVWEIDAGSSSSITITANKDGFYTLTRVVPITGAANVQLAFTAIPFTDFTEDMTAILANVESTTVPSPYPGLTTLVRNTFSQPYESLTQNQFKRIFADYQKSEDAMVVLCETGVSGNDVFEATQHGVLIKIPSVEFRLADNFEVNTLAFVDNQGTSWNDGAVPNYVWNPENSFNRKVQGALVPLILQSNLGLDGTSGGGDCPTAEQVATAVRSELTPELAEISQASVDLEEIKGDGFSTDTHSLTRLRSHVTNASQF